MSSEVPENRPTFGMARLAISSAVLVALLAAGWIWMYGVPEALLPGAEAEPGVSESEGDADSGSSSLAAPPATAVPVRTEIARRTDLVMRITATGNAEATRRLTVTAGAQGPIADILVDEGDVVSAGAVLVRLDDAELALAVQRAREQLVMAVSRFQENQVFMDIGSLDEEARRDLETALRSPEQFEELIDDPRFDEVFETITRDEVMAAQDNLLGAYSNYAETKLQLDRATVTAPFDGQIAGLEAVIGQRVSAGTELMQLVAADPLRVRADVLEADAGLIRVGRAATVRFAAYPGQTFTGRVEAVSPIMDPEKKTLEAIIRLPNPELLLKPGMFATITLETQIFSDRLLVPASAVLLRDDRPMLFVVRDGRADWIYIQEGLKNEEMIEVLDGVEPGDEVIVSGHYSLAHDAPVRVVEDDETLPDEGA